MATVLIPAPLRKLTNNADTVIVEGNTINGLLNSLEAGYPGILERLLDSDHNLRTFVNIYKNNEDIRFLDGLNTSITSIDEISIIPAIAGG